MHFSSINYKARLLIPKNFFWGLVIGAIVFVWDTVSRKIDLNIGPYNDFVSDLTAADKEMTWSQILTGTLFTILTKAFGITISVPYVMVENWREEPTHMMGFVFLTKFVAGILLFLVIRRGIFDSHSRQCRLAEVEWYRVISNNQYLVPFLRLSRFNGFFKNFYSALICNTFNIYLLWLAIDSAI